MTLEEWMDVSRRTRIRARRMKTLLLQDAKKAAIKGQSKRAMRLTLTAERAIVIAERWLGYLFDEMYSPQTFEP